MTPTAIAGTAGWNLRVGLIMVLGIVLVFVFLVTLVLGLVWAAGGFMTRACDEIERRPITVRRGETTILADVCVGAWH